MREGMENRIEGFIEVDHGSVWYEKAGAGEPLLLLHGGPGAASGCLADLMDLATHGYEVTRYDQLGSGKSDRPDNTSLWVFDRFVQEVDTIRSAFGFEKMHLLGQSWGSFLALEYALHFPDRLQSLVLYSGAASTMQCFDGMNALRARLGSEMVATMRRFEESGDVFNPEYLAAIDLLLRRHLCKRNPWPDCLTEGMNEIAMPVYTTMWGPNEFTLTGNLAPWDRRDRLPEISVPTLILCGRDDEVVPACSETMHAGITGSELVIFEDSSHMSHLEEPDRFYPVLLDFLQRNAA